MTTKKMTRDEAEKAANNWKDAYIGITYSECIDNNVVVFGENVRGAIARFSFTPPHPEIGTVCKFWNNIKACAIIAKLQKADSDGTFLASNCEWYDHCEPYTLIDPAEHEKLKMVNYNQRNQIEELKDTIENLKF